ncbi:SRPBCC family protein [Catellatospora vulcania]|uniref:SRPBCC family protein n=1 Tax=Catellatospora vulcania TaxID=1460450 RepID=UPI0018AF842F|nr:SRPBCC family protein [Catellatospora vulcania]
MSTVTESVDVHVPVRTAYNQWTRVESFPNFMKGVESVEQVDATHSHWVVNMAGAVREFDTEITDQHPDERIAWKSTSGQTEHAGFVTFHRLGESDTRVTVHLDWKPEGFLENLGCAIGADRRQVKADAQRFKKFIEERGSDTRAGRGEVETPNKRV